MNTTEPAVPIGMVDGQPVNLEEGKGQNPSVIEHAGRRCRQGYADVVLGLSVAAVYAAWYAANRAAR